MQKININRTINLKIDDKPAEQYFCDFCGQNNKSLITSNTKIKAITKLTETKRKYVIEDYQLDHVVKERHYEYTIFGKPKEVIDKKEYGRVIKGNPRIADVVVEEGMSTDLYPAICLDCVKQMAEQIKKIK